MKDGHGVGGEGVKERRGKREEGKVCEFGEFRRV